MKREIPVGIRNCSIARALDEIGDRWSLLIMRELFMGSFRFGHFCDVLGIARNLLSERLARLEEHGIVERFPLPDEPHRDGYRLTDKGRDAYPVILSLLQWGDRWLSGADGPPVLLADRKTGKPVDGMRPVNVDGEPVDPADLDILPGPGAEPPTRKRYERLAARRRG